MSRRLTVPDSDDLPALIRDAFDALPGPDAERLESIERHLGQYLAHKRILQQQRRMNWILWLLLLLGGTASAGWWLGAQYMDDKTPVAPGIEQTAPLERSSTESNDGQESEHEPVKRQSPIIYQRGQ